MSGLQQRTTTQPQRRTFLSKSGNSFSNHDQQPLDDNGQDLSGISTGPSDWSSTTSDAILSSSPVTVPSNKFHDSNSSSKHPYRRLLSLPVAASSTEERQSDNNLRLMSALTLTGIATTLLTTIFSIFHVDMFLSVYHLPLHSYATGNFIYAFINTANDVGGAWIVDTLAETRTSLVGWTGCLFSLFFLTLFFRVSSTSILSNTFHFIVSMSLYDTMYSFSSILFGSMFTDNHTLSKKERVAFMASGRTLNMVASFTVAKIGLEFFDTSTDLRSFQIFVVTVACITCLLFWMAHIQMTSDAKMCYLLKQDDRKKNDNEPSNPRTKRNKRQPLKMQQVLKDFAMHKNFCAWIGMEMLFECQTNFSSSFLKIFVDRLLHNDGGFSRESCDWILSTLRPLTQLVGLAFYIPIQKFGYHALYSSLFIMKFIFALVLFLFVSHPLLTERDTLAAPQHQVAIASFIILNQVLSHAVQSWGFQLAMADMVTEMKHNQIVRENRKGEPSLAGLFMGANALLCKPVDSLLPIVAAWTLDRVGFSNTSSSNEEKLSVPVDDDLVRIQWALFYLLIGPSLIFSLLQWIAWSRYDLDCGRADSMREELILIEGKAKEIELIA